MGYTGCLIGIPGIVYEIIPIQVCSISSTIYRKQPGPLFSLLTCGNASYCTPTKAAGSSQNWWFLDLGFSNRCGWKKFQQIFFQMVFFADLWWYKENNHLTQSPRKNWLLTTEQKSKDYPNTVLWFQCIYNYSPFDMGKHLHLNEDPRFPIPDSKVVVRFRYALTSQHTPGTHRCLNQGHS